MRDIILYVANALCVEARLQEQSVGLYPTLFKLHIKYAVHCRWAQGRFSNQPGDVDDARRTRCTKMMLIYVLSEWIKRPLSTR